MSNETPVDPAALREEVKSKYREVALNPHGEFHFHTGRPLAARLGYDTPAVDALPDAAVESFAGVANPFSLRPLQPGARVVDVGSGGGFDCFIAVGQVGPEWPAGTGLWVAAPIGTSDIRRGACSQADARRVPERIQYRAQEI